MMQISLPDELSTKDVKTIFAALDNKVRFIGGCIRNSLSNTPITDIDMATSIEPNNVMKRLEQNNIKAVATGIEHGTVTAVINKTHYEITSLRKDISCDGRHAQVEFTDDWQEDSNRRDFTFNAISCDLGGQIFDYHNGIDDLNNNIARFIGNASDRCKEDKLRILRFFRFHAYYPSDNFDQDSINACIEFKDSINSLSKERILAEMTKLLSAKSIATTLEKMQEIGLLDIIFQLPLSLENIGQLLKIEEQLDIPINPLLRIATIIDLNNDNVGNLADNWRMSNRDKKILQQLAATKDIKSLDEKTIKGLVRKYGNQITAHMVIIKILNDRGDNDKLSSLYELSMSWRAPTFPLKGSDLIELGLKPGPKFNEILSAAENRWEESNYTLTKDQLLKDI